MKRLFFALWPSEAVRAKIDALNQAVDLPNTRRLSPQNLHLTLLYLGLIDTTTQHGIVAEVDKVSIPSFDFVLDGVAHWQGPRILCLTVSHQPKPMVDLVEALIEIVKPYPIFLHGRPYRAHVTLLRKVRQPYCLPVSPIHWQADAFVLVESISTPNGVRYEVLQSWALQ